MGSHPFCMFSYLFVCIQRWDQSTDGFGTLSHPLALCSNTCRTFTCSMQNYFTTVLFGLSCQHKKSIWILLSISYLFVCIRKWDQSTDGFGTRRIPTPGPAGWSSQTRGGLRPRGAAPRCSPRTRPRFGPTWNRSCSRTFRVGRKTPESIPTKKTRPVWNGFHNCLS